LVESRKNLYPTVVGALLFAKKPSFLLGYSGITVTKYATIERDYNYVDFRLDEPIMNTFSEHGEKERNGLINEALEKVKSIILEKSSASLEGATRVIDYPYPEEGEFKLQVHHLMPSRTLHGVTGSRGTFWV